jgi:hypothetical protein
MPQLALDSDHGNLLIGERIFIVQGTVVPFLGKYVVLASHITEHFIIPTYICNKQRNMLCCVTELSLGSSQL